MHRGCCAGISHGSFPVSGCRSCRRRSRRRWPLRAVRCLPRKIGRHECAGSGQGLVSTRADRRHVVSGSSTSPEPVIHEKIATVGYDQHGFEIAQELVHAPVLGKLHGCARELARHCLELFLEPLQQREGISRRAAKPATMSRRRARGDAPFAPCPLMTVCPRLTCPSPTTTTCPPRRTARIVVPCHPGNLSSTIRPASCHCRAMWRPPRMQQGSGQGPSRNTQSPVGHEKGAPRHPFTHCRAASDRRIDPVPPVPPLAPRRSCSR